MNTAAPIGSGSTAGAQFDSFAQRYAELHASSVKITGEGPEYFAEYKASYIARILPPGPCKILDYGCGIGMLSRHLMRTIPAARIDGFDPSQESIARVDPVLRARGLYTSNLAHLGCDYNLIVIANVLHHVKPGDRQNLINNAASRLVRAGKLVIFEHNPVNPLTRRAVAHCAFDGDAILLWPKETILYMNRAGLTTARDYIVFFPRLLDSLRRFEPLLRSCPLGAQYAVIGTKKPNRFMQSSLACELNNTAATGSKSAPRASAAIVAAFLIAGLFAALNLSTWYTRITYPGDESYEGVPLAKMVQPRQEVPIYNPPSEMRFADATYGPLYYFVGSRLQDPEPDPIIR